MVSDVRFQAGDVLLFGRALAAVATVLDAAQADGAATAERSRGGAELWAALAAVALLLAAVESAAAFWFSRSK
jgi:hypothetical protein